MRTRLLGVFVAVVAILVLGLGVPLAVTTAGNERSGLFLDRLADASRYASLAQRLVQEDGPAGDLEAQLDSYRQIYGISAEVFDRGDSNGGSDFRRLAGQGVDATDPIVHQGLIEARSGKLPEQTGTMMPWDSAALVLAVPVLVNGEVRGVVVTQSPTGRVTTRILLWWTIIALGGLLAICIAILVALPLVRWMLRPIHKLDNATAALLPAVVNGRRVDPVGGDSGPPELRRLTRSFDQMAANVVDVLAAQRAFVADASHQLRNPLTALRLRLSNLEGQLDPDADGDQVAALEEADRLNRILDELLAMARAESSSVDPIPVEVDGVVSARLRAWQAVAASRGVALVLDGEPGGRALAPPRALETVLDALLDNALKFTDEGSVVQLDVRSWDGRVYFTVRDHGSGLLPDELERATDRFWRSQSHQNIHGSGLGLAIVRLLVERVDGTVILEVPEDGGLRVRFDLPSFSGTMA